VKFKEPVIVDEIEIDARDFPKPSLGRQFVFVSVRPCDTEKYPDGTYLGILLGDLPINWFAQYDKETKKISINGYGNPAILVLGKDGIPLGIVYGAGSWWGEIKGPEDLEDITDEDIQNVWYVKALKVLTKQKEEEVDD
jgi:hypothetical protein